MQFLTMKLPAYLPLILLSVALLVGLIVARRMWMEAHEDLEPASERMLLSDLEKAYYSGELDEDEMRRVRELISRSKGANLPAADARLGRVPEPPSAEAGPASGDDSEESPAAAS